MAAAKFEHVDGELTRIYWVFEDENGINRMPQFRWGKWGTKLVPAWKVWPGDLEKEAERCRANSSSQLKRMDDCFKFAHNPRNIYCDDWIRFQRDGIMPDKKAA